MDSGMETRMRDSQVLDLGSLHAELVAQNKQLRAGERIPDGPYIRTASNILFPILAPDPRLIRLWDIAIGTARQIRFAGHYPWSVCKHHLLVFKLVQMAGGGPLEQVIAAIHDGSEGYTNDQILPMQVAFAIEVARIAGQLGEHEIDMSLKFHARKKIDARIDRSIRESLGLPIEDTPEIAAFIKKADVIAAEIEKMTFGAGYPEDFRGLDDIKIPEEIKTCIRFWAELDDIESARCWLSTFNAVYGTYLKIEGRDRRMEIGDAPETVRRSQAFSPA